MKYHLVITILTFSVFQQFSVAQEEDESCLPPSKKVLKLIETGSNAPDAKSAVDNYNAAIDAAPDNAMAFYEYGLYAYNSGIKYYETQPNPVMGDKSFVKSEEMFKKALEFCPDYHADCFYYLGVINYSQKEKDEAIKWFKGFRDFKNADNNRYPSDYDKKILDVKEILQELQVEQDLLVNEVPFSPSIVKNVSSDKDEYFPMISPDNELIFYTRKLDRANLGDLVSKMVEEFTFSQRVDLKSDFDNGEPLKPPFNDGTFTNYGSATLSVDNKEMIICACRKEQVYGREYLNCDLYMTTYERSGEGGNDFKWTPLKNMGPGINSPDGWEAQPSLSSDGQTLFFTASRPTTRDNDIFIVKRNEDGTWGQARAFDEINTEGKDKSPFLHQDSETLYFVSSTTDKRKGVGGLDIFYIREENGKWLQPKNIGYPINSKEDELGLFVSTDGKLAYYSSRVGGNWNIYSFELYEEARPKPVVILKGELKDEKGAPITDATIEIAYAGSGEVSKVKVNGNDGKYAAVVKLDKKQDVMVTVQKEGHAFDSKLINKEDIKKDEVIIKNNNLTVKPLKVGEAYTINDILYATNSAELNEKSKFILKGFARFLQQNSEINVAIQGHTDDQGDNALNLSLSESRAKGVKDYLVSQGISEKRLSAKGFGETAPKVPNISEVNRAKNRRTDFVILKL
jgi:outer membrane protein OmpA-like peptidoglycan-associated protein/Tol biopolymer transport system component